MPTAFPKRDLAVAPTRYPMNRIIVIASLIVLAAVVLNGLQYKLLGWSIIVPMKEWLSHFKMDNSDSWMPMRAALDYARTVGPSSMYQDVFFHRHVKFQYPPSALLPLVALQSLGIDTTNVFLNNVNRALIIVNAVGVGWLFRLILMRTRGQDVAASPAGTSGAVLAGIATLLFYPIMMGFWLGQLQVWIDTVFTFACIAVLCSRQMAAGALVGLICLLKPQFGVFALWAILRREGRFLVGAAVIFVPCSLISLYLFGLLAHLEYLRELSFLSQRGEALIANNSVNGILNALLRTANPLVWDAHGFPPYNPIVRFGSLAAAVILILAALWPRPRGGALNGLLDFQFAALAFTMSAPIAWEHHYGILAPILATLFSLILAAPDSAKRRQQLVAFAILFFLSDICVTSNRYTVATVLNLAYGYLFFAGLGVLAMLVWVSRPRYGGAEL